MSSINRKVIWPPQFRTQGPSSHCSIDLCGDQLQIQTITTSVFSNLVVMCEICFGKKKPEPMTEDGSPMLSAAKRQLNADFRRVEIRRDEFCMLQRRFSEIEVFNGLTIYFRPNHSRLYYLSALFHAGPSVLCPVDRRTKRRYKSWSPSV